MIYYYYNELLIFVGIKEISLNIKVYVLFTYLLKKRMNEYMSNYIC